MSGTRTHFLCFVCRGDVLTCDQYARHESVMTKLLSLLFLLSMLIAAYILLKPVEDDAAGVIEGLPWQIESLLDGSSRVFGVTLGQSTLAETREQMGDDMELAIIVVDVDDRGLEMFYKRYTAGVFTGKLIVAADIAPDVLQQFLERASKVEYLQSGARKFHLNAADRKIAYQAPVKSITFIPSIDIDEHNAIKHFGTPAKTIRRDDKVAHLLYPGKGLDLIINPQGKDVLQYVAPRDFAQLLEPLM